MKDLTVTLEDRPGTLADLGEALGRAGVNIEGISGFPCEGKGLLHILVKDVEVARAALKNVNIEIKAERDILVWDIAEKDVVGKPGSLGTLCRHLANAGVNINLIYQTENNRVVLGVDDIEKARNII
jgi:hypothetical protein